MKHKISVTLTILTLFIITQALGLFVVNAYSPIINPETQEPFENQTTLPYGLETPEDQTPSFISIIFSFALAFALIFLLMKYKWKIVIRIWFFSVITLALALSLNAIFKTFNFSLLTSHFSTLALLVALPLAFLKIFRPNVYIHNSTELLIYPGIAAVFVPILTPTTAILLLLAISIYDAWAVWKSGIMQKMANFQMTELKIFGGFLIPSASEKVKNQIKKIKTKYKGKKIPKSIQNKKFKVNMAILGGGDVIFPIITAGVFMRAFGLTPAILITLGALAGLISIFIFSKKGKAYPAMPYITTGIIIALLIWKLFF